VAVAEERQLERARRFTNGAWVAFESAARKSGFKRYEWVSDVFLRDVASAWLAW